MGYYAEEWGCSDVCCANENILGDGLAEQKGYGHLQLDPALPSYMLSQITETDKEAMQVKWAEVMVGFAESYT